MATFTKFLNRQNKKRLSLFLCPFLLIPISQAQAQTDSYSPPGMFDGAPSVDAPVRRSSENFVRPSLKSRSSSPEDAELNKEFKPYIPKFAPPPMAPDPIDQAPAAQGIEVQSIITPPLPAKKPKAPVMAQQETAPEAEKPAAEINRPVIKKTEPQKTPAPEAPEPQPPAPTNAEVVEQPERPEKPQGVVKGPKTMPAAPATDVTAEITEDKESPVEDGALMERHNVEQQKQQTEEDIKDVPLPGSFKAVPDQEMTQRLMVFEKGKTELSAEEISFLQKELAAFLKANPGVQLDIVGFASADPFEPSGDKRVALSRVMAIRSILMNEGVSPEQLNLRAMGAKTDKTPVDRVDLYLK